jgi:uncharacterized membrane protein
MGKSLAAAANPATDVIQRAVHEGVSGIVWLVIGFLAIQMAALVCGVMVARSMFPDSKKKRKLVMDLAGLLGISVGAAFVILALWSRRSGL